MHGTSSRSLHGTSSRSLLWHVSLPAWRILHRPGLSGAISNSSGVFNCKRMPPASTIQAAATASRCGWAWGTRYYGAEAANGIDELGFLSSRAMVAEVRSLLCEASWELASSEEFPLGTRLL